jgi:hypothetical protein
LETSKNKENRFFNYQTERTKPDGNLLSALSKLKRLQGINMSSETFRIDWSKIAERVQKAKENETPMDFCGHEISVDKDTLEKFKEWKERVSLPLEKLGAIGGEFTYCMTPTSIGVAYVVRHSSGEQFDLTNYDLW